MPSAKRLSATPESAQRGREGFTSQDEEPVTEESGRKEDTEVEESSALISERDSECGTKETKTKMRNLMIAVQRGNTQKALEEILPLLIELFRTADSNKKQIASLTASQKQLQRDLQVVESGVLGDAASLDYIYYRRLADEALRAIFDGACVVISLSYIGTDGVMKLQESFTATGKLDDHLFWRRLDDCFWICEPKAKDPSQPTGWRHHGGKPLWQVLPSVQPSNPGDVHDTSQLVSALKPMLQDAIITLRDVVEDTRGSYEEKEKAIAELQTDIQDYAIDFEQVFDFGIMDTTKIRNAINCIPVVMDGDDIDELCRRDNVDDWEFKKSMYSLKGRHNGAVQKQAALHTEVRKVKEKLDRAEAFLYFARRAEAILSDNELVTFFIHNRDSLGRKLGNLSAHPHDFYGRGHVTTARINNRFEKFDGRLSQQFFHTREAEVNMTKLQAAFVSDQPQHLDDAIFYPADMAPWLPTFIEQLPKIHGKDYGRILYASGQALSHRARPSDSSWQTIPLKSRMQNEPATTSNSFSVLPVEGSGSGDHLPGSAKSADSQPGPSSSKLNPSSADKRKKGLKIFGGYTRGGDRKAGRGGK